MVFCFGSKFRFLNCNDVYVMLLCDLGEFEDFVSYTVYVYLKYV